MPEIEQSVAENVASRLVDPRAITSIRTFHGSSEPELVGLSQDQYVISVWVSANPLVWKVLSKLTLPKLQMHRVPDCPGKEALTKFISELTVAAAQAAINAGLSICQCVQSKHVGLPAGTSGPALVMLVTSWPLPPGTKCLILTTESELIPSFDESGKQLVAVQPSAASPQKQGGKGARSWWKPWQ